MATEQSTSSHTAAPEYPLPASATHFYSVEYPGYVQHSSVPLAVRNLGGTPRLENAFKRTAARNEALLELNLRCGNPYAHPIPGDVVGTGNILVKVTKRKRRQPGHDGVVGEYTAEPLGVIFKTVRFRSKSGCYHNNEAYSLRGQVWRTISFNPKCRIPSHSCGWQWTEWVSWGSWHDHRGSH